MNAIPASFKQLSLVAAVVVMMMAVTVGMTSAQEAPIRTVTVVGSGETFGTPDIAYIYLGVDNADANVSVAIEQSNRDISAIVEAVSALGIDRKDIQTANFSVYPEERYNPTTGEPTGERVYRVQQMLNIIVRDITQAGAVLDTSIGAGADVVNGLSLGIADTQSLETEARVKAVEDARQRATELATAFGMTLGDATVVSEVTAGYPVYPMDRGLMSADMGGQGSQVNLGQLSVSVQITVTFAMSK